MDFDMQPGRKDWKSLWLQTPEEETRKVSRNLIHNHVVPRDWLNGSDQGELRDILIYYLRY